VEVTNQIKIVQQEGKKLTKPSWDEYFLGIAEAVSKRASCPRFSVGAVIVDKNNRILATGYNGAPSLQEECTEIGCNIIDDHCKRAVHAEINAYRYIPFEKAYLSSRLYVTLEPCDRCNQILQRYLPWIDVKWATSQEEYRAMRDKMSLMPNGPETN
jgi:dCMP deaminase